MFLAAGEILAGKYRIDGPIAEGGMGVVYRATHVDLQQRVAVKVHQPEHLSPVSIERLLREARSTASLRTEHVVRVLDVGRLADQAPFIVMEELEGESLDHRIERGPLPLVDAAEIAIQVCAALAEAHAAGIVHRDLKPSNVFLVRNTGPGVHVKLLDFGISKSIGDEETSLTKSGALIGSPLYMSPEQVRNARTVDARSDVWSLGITLYEMLSGVVPFNGESVGAVLLDIAGGMFARLDQRNPAVPADVADLVGQCIQTNVEARPRDVAEIAARLSGLAPPRTLVLVEKIVGLLHPGKTLDDFKGKGFASTRLALPDAGVVVSVGRSASRSEEPRRSNAGMIVGALGILVAIVSIAIVVISRAPKPAPAPVPTPVLAIAPAASSVVAPAEVAPPPTLAPEPPPTVSVVKPKALPRPRPTAAPPSSSSKARETEM